MKNDIFLPVSFYLKTQIINISKDNIKRRIRKLKNDDRNIIKLMKVNNIECWTINYKHLEFFKRIRKPKNYRGQKSKEYNFKSSSIDKNYDYKYEITISLTDGCNLSKVKGRSYDIQYYNYIVNLFYSLNKRNMFYVIERDENNFNHLHFGVNGDKDELTVILDYLLNQIDQINDVTSSKAKKNVHFEEIIDQYAYKKYLMKNNSKVGSHETLKFIYEEDN